MGILHADLNVFLLLCQANLAEYIFMQNNVLNKSYKKECTCDQFTFTISHMVYVINEQELLHYVYLVKSIDSTANSELLNTCKDN
jgi:hypothetical protein